ncbi:MAG: putative quinol monooxygenase [Chloroflexota bacterium]
MSELFFFSATHTIKEGKVEEFKKYVRELVEIVQANEPRVLAFNIYMNDDGTEVTNVQVHPDADSMVFHMQVWREKIGGSYEFVETDSIEFCGTPNDQVLQMARQLAGSGVSMNVKSHHLGGFTRF